MERRSRRAKRERQKKQLQLEQRPPINYDSFGILGPAFQKLHEQRWTAAETTWDSLRARPYNVKTEVVDLPPLKEAMETYLHLSDMLVERFIFWSDRDPAFIGKTVTPFWNNTLRKIFMPWLPDMLTSIGDTRRHQIRRELQVNISKATHLNRQDALSMGCYGPFTASQLEYVLQNDPRLIEAGAGSGYFLACFEQLGGDGIGFDSNRYGISDKPLPWTESMRASGRLRLIDGLPPDEDFRDRTLLISWPEPGGALPLEALNRYTALGGRRVLFKLGGFVGSSVQTPAEQANVFGFFRTLAAKWGEAPLELRPQFDPLLAENNLFVFRRKGS